MALSRDVQLAPFNEWEVGGSAEYFCLPRSTDELAAFQKWAEGQHLEIHIIGDGGRVLISDQGLSGLTICLRNFPGEVKEAEGVFQNPKGQRAAAIIADCGLQGFRVGQARVSVTDANAIENLGGAKASDIWSVIKHVRRVVFEKKKIELRTEVVLLGQWSDLKGGIA